jgi:hypothetical protein
MLSGTWFLCYRLFSYPDVPYPFVEAQILDDDDTALDGGADVGSVNLWMHSLLSHTGLCRWNFKYIQFWFRAFAWVGMYKCHFYPKCHSKCSVAWSANVWSFFENGICTPQLMQMHEIRTGFIWSSTYTEQKGLTSALTDQAPYECAVSVVGQDSIDLPVWLVLWILPCP